jgi:diguanylate cyclase (GGDEF)-like protein
LISALLWLYADLHRYEHVFVPLWNSAVLLCFLLVVEKLVSHLQGWLENEKVEARTDRLTMLPNLLGFTEQAEKLFGLSARHNRHISLVYLDVDNFRQLNEKFGQREGDDLLRKVGKKIASSLRASDVAGRIGKDVFTIALPETDESGARAMVNTLRMTLMQEMESNSWPASFSMGVASFNSPRANLDDAIRVADSLMYQAKQNGKNGAVFGSYPAA